jgi:hypothetical protein
MVPAAYICLKSLPLTPNGKLDRKALPSPDGNAYSTGAYEAPRDSVEAALVQIWERVLEVQPIGIRTIFLCGRLLAHGHKAFRLDQQTLRSFPADRDHLPFSDNRAAGYIHSRAGDQHSTGSDSSLGDQGTSFHRAFVSDL